MNSRLLRSAVVLVPLALILAHAVRTFLRERTAWRLFHILGVGCLILVGFYHVCEALEWFSGMRWGAPDSVGHYLDLGTLALGIALVLMGSLGRSGVLGRHRQD